MVLWEEALKLKARVDARKDLMTLAVQASSILLKKMAFIGDATGRVTYHPEYLLPDTPQERYDVIKALTVLNGLAEKYVIAGIKIADREVRAELRRLYRETA